jgi:hypothetical protein
MTQLVMNRPQVAERPEVSSQRATPRRRREKAPRRLQARRAFGFVFALLLALLLAFNGGGYDVVIRHQVGLVVWAVIAVGLGTGLLPRAKLTPATWVALAGFGALAGLTLLAHIWTMSDERTTEELARVLQYAGLVVLAYLALNRYSWRGAALGFATAAMVVPFFAVGARLFPHLLTDHVAAYFGFDRLSYPLDYWNGVACWGAMAVAVGLTLSANSPRIAIRAAALAATPIAALSVYLTYSRFGVASVAIAVVAAVAIGKNRWTAAVNALAAAGGSAALILVARSHHEIAHATGSAGAESVILVALAAGIACAAIAAMTFRAGLDSARMELRAARVALGVGVAVLLLAGVALNGPLGRAWGEFKDDKSPASTGGTERLTTLGGTRYQVWSTGVDAFKSEPWRGIGPGTFEYYWAQHGKEEEFVRDAHSLYIEEAAELGIPGLIALLVALGGLLWAAVQARLRWRRRREIAAGSAMIALFVVFLAYAGVDWMWELGAVGALAIGGIAVAGAGGLERASRSKIRTWTRVALVAGALLVGAVQVPGLVSTQRTRASASALARGDARFAQHLADQAIDAEDWAASPYAARALASEGLGQLGAAKQDAQHAIDREPDNWRYRLLIARIEAESGQGAAARRQIAAARRLAPRYAYLSPASPAIQQLNLLLSRRAG